MIDIKLPVKWLNEKCVPIVIGDSWDDPVSTGEVCESTIDSFNSMLFADTFITSFADRENTGKQPVEDWVPVICIAYCGTTYKCNTGMNWSLDGPSTTYNISYWKPDDKALMEIYLAEKSDNITPPKTSPDEDKVRVSYHLNINGGLDFNVTEANKPEPKSEAEKVTFCSRMEMSRPPIPSECGSFMVNVCSHSDNITPPEPKKETKLKLTKDDVGKKFEDRFEQVYKIQLCTDSDVAVTDNDGHIFVCDYDGVFENAITNQLIKRHEPRYWLKDLPDADLFTYDWIACDENGEWYNYEYSPPILSDVAYGAGGGEMFCMACIKYLPKLTGDEWKLSKISIDDLREWKRVNK